MSDGCEPGGEMSDLLHGVIVWYCERCGLGVDGWPAASPAPACPRCHAVRWTTRNWTADDPAADCGPWPRIMEEAE